MTTQLHTTGEEFALDKLFREDTLGSVSEVSIGLYHDGEVSGDTDDGDDLGDDATPDDIDTEPGGSSYSRQTASFDSSDFDVQENGDGNYEVVITDQVYDTTDSSQDIDAYFVVVTFESDHEGDGSQNDNLYWTGNLDQLYDLNSVDEFTLSGAGLELE